MNLLSLVLAKYIDQPLTLALARRIAREVSPWQPYDPRTWAPAEFGPYTFQCERFWDARAHLEAQRVQYVAETRTGEPNNTDWDRIIDLQRQGAHVIFTARDQRTGDIVGSCWLFVGQDIDSGAHSVTDDMLYVHPEHRGGLLGLKLVQYSERCIFALGVREATFHFRLENGADRMARFLGYQPVSQRVRKTHRGDDFAGVPTRHTKDLP